MVIIYIVILLLSYLGELLFIIKVNINILFIIKININIFLNYLELRSDWVVPVLFSEFFGYNRCYGYCDKGWEEWEGDFLPWIFIIFRAILAYGTVSMFFE